MSQQKQQIEGGNSTESARMALESTRESLRACPAVKAYETLLAIDPKTWDKMIELNSIAGTHNLPNALKAFEDQGDVRLFRAIDQTLSNLESENQ